MATGRSLSATTDVLGGGLLTSPVAHRQVSPSSSRGLCGVGRPAHSKEQGIVRGRETREGAGIVRGRETRAAGSGGVCPHAEPTIVRARSGDCAGREPGDGQERVCRVRSPRDAASTRAQQARPAQAAGFSLNPGGFSYDYGLAPKAAIIPQEQ